MKLKRPLPPNRNYEQLLNHYQVEKALADRLRTATRDERKKLYAHMYDDLFAAVPDHPRLTRRRSAAETQLANQTKMAMVGRLLNPALTFAEFASGDCCFLKEVSPAVKQAIGIDISDQRDPSSSFPVNCRLVIYDGYDLSTIVDSTIDVLFSDQLIEHFHPDDTLLHFQTAFRIIKPGGRYVFSTPHLLTGPYDISKYFSDTPEGFHLREWTFSEISPVLRQAGFTRLSPKLILKKHVFTLPLIYFNALEFILGGLPRSFARPVANILLRQVVIEAIK